MLRSCEQRDLTLVTIPAEGPEAYAMISRADTSQLDGHPQGCSKGWVASLMIVNCASCDVDCGCYQGSCSRFTGCKFASLRSMASSATRTSCSATS